jgi:hypothetical protein
MARGKGPVAGFRGSTEERKSPRRGRASFYQVALSEAERVLLPQAKEIEGLDEEIALLRVRLRSMVAEQPENWPHFLKGMELLVKAVGAKYRLSKRAQGDLMDSVMGVLEGIGSAVLGEVGDGSA